MNPIYDLDNLLPEPKHIKLGGKILLCNIPSIRQLIQIARLESEMANLKDEDISTVMDKIKSVLVPILPEIADDPDFDIKPSTFANLMDYIKQISSENKVVSQEFTPKKKVASPEE